jgi:hypothetical protein
MMMRFNPYTSDIIVFNTIYVLALLVVVWLNCPPSPMPESTLNMPK